MAEMRNFSVTLDEYNTSRNGSIGLIHPLKYFLCSSEFGIMLRIIFTDGKERKKHM